MTKGNQGRREYSGRPELVLPLLRDDFPNWFAWCVPGLGHTTWCGYRLPRLGATSAGALAADMAKVECRPLVELAGTLSDDVVPLSGRERLPILDRLRAELRSTFPNWRINYTPHRDGPVSWEAHRLPILRADSAEALAEDMRSAQSSGLLPDPGVSHFYAREG